MNLSMEDRGLLNKEQQAPAGSRYLSGDIRCGVRAWARVKLAARAFFHRIGFDVRAAPAKRCALCTGASKLTRMG